LLGLPVTLPLVRLIPPAVAIVVVVFVRFVLIPRLRVQRGPGREMGRVRWALLLLPAVMIGMAALSGAFSALGTALGLALAPIGFSAGVGLALIARRPGRQQAAAGAQPNGVNNTAWVFIGLVVVRMAVVVASGGDQSQSVLHILSADLLLVSVGMAITRIGMTLWAGRTRRPITPTTNPALPARGLHVMVVGGGIAGLCLAQGLRKAQIDVAVYERGGREARSSWFQGYQIHINGAGSAALAECLPTAVKTSFDARALRPSEGVQVLTPKLDVMHRSEAGLAGSNPIVRSTLRRVLLEGIDDIVRFNCEFAHYEQTDDGRIKADFVDGTSDTGDVLVGADGIRSAVRAQYLPQSQVREIGLVGAAGKLPIDKEVLSYIPGSLLTHLNSIASPDGLYMIVTESIHKPGTDRAAIELTSDEHDHLIWVLVSRPEPYGEDPKSIFRDGEALQSVVVGLMADWHPSLTRMVRETDPRVISATALHASNVIEPWQPSQVTLIGDAIHTMPPLRGLGGSTALRDAAVLYARLVEAERNRTSVVDAIGAYEAEMRGYGFAAVQSSLEFAVMLLQRRFEPRGLRRANC
jgi:2-polyprenyl-6-methoxyphenol hydroxylase-like FAD-dependent oxidoreductase